MWDLEKNSQNTVLVDDEGNSLSYSSLNNFCIRLSSLIPRRCLVFILCENKIGSILGYVSCVNNKIVPVLLNAHLERNLLNNLIQKYLPLFLWIPSNMSSDFSQFQSVFSIFGYSLIKTSFSSEFQLNDDLCLLLTTSGSTGSPKFVKQSYTNVKSNAESIVRYLELDDSERPITTLPMNYTYGLSIINSHLMVGATILLTDKGLMQKEFWTFFKEKKATSFGGVPYTYEMLERLRFFKMELPSLRYMTQAGGKLTTDLHKKFAQYAVDKNIKFFVMYGQCEATARMGYLPSINSLRKCGSMGIAIPGGKFHLIDADGNEINKPFMTGELVYEGLNVTMGYAEKGDDLLLGDERNGILQTGDMAQFDEDGYYYIVGRKKRFLKIYGNRVNLDEIDRIVKEEFHNVDVASAGIDDHMYIFITGSLLGDELIDFVSYKTGLNRVAFKVINIEKIPRNDSGKVLYQELSKYYEKK